MWALNFFDFGRMKLRSLGQQGKGVIEQGCDMLEISGLGIPGCSLWNLCTVT